MRLYVVWCRKCGKYLFENPVTGKNKREAFEKANDFIKRHDLVLHGEDGEWLDVDLVRFVPER